MPGQSGPDDRGTPTQQVRQHGAVPVAVDPLPAAVVGPSPAAGAPVAAGPAPGAPALRVYMPLDYTAFCLLHQERYLRYTFVRLVDQLLTETVVGAALGDLATMWPAALRSSCPAAVGWKVLTSRVSRAYARCGADAPAGDGGLHRLLPPVQADVLILRYRLSLSAAETAALMGIEEPTVACQLLMAERAVPPSLTGVLHAVRGAGPPRQARVDVRDARRPGGERGGNAG